MLNLSSSPSYAVITRSLLSSSSFIWNHALGHTYFHRKPQASLPSVLLAVSAMLLFGCAIMSSFWGCFSCLVYLAIFQTLRCWNAYFKFINSCFANSVFMTFLQLLHYLPFCEQLWVITIFHPSSLPRVWSNQKQTAKMLLDTNTSRFYSSHVHQIIPGLFPGLLVLDVPQSYGAVTVMVAVIPCKASIQFLWKWRYCLPFPRSCISVMRLHWTKTSLSYHLFSLAHHTPDGRYTSSDISHGKMKLKTASAGSYFSPQLKSRERLVFFHFCLRRKYNKPLKNKVLIQHWGWTSGKLLG